MAESPSRIPIKIKVAGAGEASGELVRFSAPLTIENLLKRMPLEGRAHPLSGGHSFILGMKRGTEKAVRDVKAGDIAYWPMGDSLCIYHSDARPYSPVNTVGRVIENLELFRSLRSGTRIRIELA